MCSCMYNSHDIALDDGPAGEMPLDVFRIGIKRFSYKQSQFDGWC